MELWKLTATEIVEKLKLGEVTPLELIDVVESRTKVVEGQLNAIPIQCFARARAAAKKLKAPPEPGPGYLYGLPIVVKDSAPVKGVPWTMGSRLYKDRVASEDDPHVELLEKNGAIVIGKSNVPELCAGANTYNEVFGETRNPWNLQKTCGGSSGGTAAALAAGEVWLGTGGDLGGSLRIPASFCGVVGFRPSVGRVPQTHLRSHGIKTISGPMARNVKDLALMLDAMAGQHSRDPESMPAPSRPFTEVVREGGMPPAKRVAWSSDLGGISPTHPDVASICQTAAQWFGTRGATVEETCPDLSDAEDIFQVIRADDFKSFQSIMNNNSLRAMLKPELQWQITKGVRQTKPEVLAAKEALELLRKRVDNFFRDYDLLCAPCVMVPPFDVSTRWLKEVQGKVFNNYVQWLILTFAFSLVDVPVISIPCGLTSSGLPVGLQIVGRHRGDAEVLYAAAEYERNHTWKDLVPLSKMKSR